jgi:hypothetical protein
VNQVLRDAVDFDTFSPGYFPVVHPLAHLVGVDGPLWTPAGGLDTHGTRESGRAGERGGKGAEDIGRWGGGGVAGGRLPGSASEDLSTLRGLSSGTRHAMISNEC